MRNLKRVLVLTLVLAMLVSAAACSLVTKDEEKDAAQVVATVNGEDIYKNEIYAAMRSDGFNYYGDPEFFFQDENADLYEGEANAILDGLISKVVAKQKAVELDLDEFTDEELADMEQNAKSLYDYYSSQVETGLLEQNLSLPTPLTDEEIATEVSNVLSYYLGVDDVSIETLLDLTKDYELQYNLNDYVIADITVDEADVQSYYDTQLESQTQLAESDMAELADIINEGTIVVYNTSPIHYVKHLLLTTKKENEELYNMAQSAYDAATTDELKETAMSLQDSIYEVLLPKAEALKARAEAGEDFDDLLAELVENEDGDEGMQYSPEGYAVTEGGGEYMQQFEAAAMALTEIGALSDPIKTLYGYHVLKLISITPVGPIAYEDIKDDIESALLSEAQSEALEAAYQEWEDEADIQRFDNALLN